MPSSDGVWLWLPDVGGLVLYLTVPFTWLRPSDGKVRATQPAALAAAGSASALAFGPGAGMGALPASLVVFAPLPPPLPETSTTATTITATTSTAPPTSCSRRVRC